METFLDQLIKDSPFIADEKIFHDIFTNMADLDHLKITRLLDHFQKIEGLSPFMIRQVNRKFIRSRTSITSLQEAFMMLGAVSAQNIILYYIMKHYFPLKKTSKRVFDHERYWKHCLGTGIAASLYAKKVTHPEPYSFILTGLTHDIGIVLLNCHAPQKLDQIMSLMQKGVEMTVAEEMVLDGLNHAEIGSQFCYRLGINRDLMNLVRRHHQPVNETPPNSDLLILYVGDLISTEYHQKLLGLRLHPNFYKKLEAIPQLNKKTILEISLALPREVERILPFYTFE